MIQGEEAAEDEAPLRPRARGSPDHDRRVRVALNGSPQPGGVQPQAGPRYISHPAHHHVRSTRGGGTWFGQLERTVEGQALQLITPRVANAVSRQNNYESWLVPIHQQIKFSTIDVRSWGRCPKFVCGTLPFSRLLYAKPTALHIRALGLPTPTHSGVRVQYLPIPFFFAFRLYRTRQPR